MSAVPRLSRGLATAAPRSCRWTCFFCQHAHPHRRQLQQQQQQQQQQQMWTTHFRPNILRRQFSSSTARPQQQQQQQSQAQAQAQTQGMEDFAPSMERVREHYARKNKTIAYYTLSLILGTVALSYGSVPMYKMICQTTGWGGQPVRAHGTSNDPSTDISDRVVPVTTAKRIKVTFNASISDTLPWKFVPQQREVSVLPGETALAFYKATNLGDKDIIGVATYSVTPAQCAPYFSKIQCFCFEEQRLNAGETVDMPVFFYLDPDLLNDLNMRRVETVTLNYTFFKARYDNNGRFQPPVSG